MCYIYIIEYCNTVRMNKLTTTCNNMDEPLKLTVKLKKPITEYRLHDSIYTEFKMSQTFGVRNQDRVYVYKSSFVVGVSGCW